MRRHAAVIVVAVLVTAGCTDTPGVEGDPSEGVSESAAPAPEAGQLRIELEELFGLQAHLIAEAGRARGAARAAVTESLDAASDDLVDAVIEAADADAIAERNLDRAGAAFIAGLARDPESAANERSIDRLADALAGVTDSLEPDGIADLVEAPITKLAEHNTAVAERDHGDAYERAREAYADMVTLGGAVAAGIIEDDPERYPGPRSTGALELRSALRQLLGEHALLAATTNRRGITAAKDFDAAAAALNGNTADLGTALDAMYDGGASFEAHWRDRISVLADHAAALGDDRGKDAARDRVRAKRLPDRLAGVLARLSDDAVSDQDTSRALERLDTALLTHARTFADKRYDDAEQAKQDAYDAALELADVIAADVAADQPDVFPTE